MVMCSQKNQNFGKHRGNADAQARTSDMLMSNVTGIWQKDCSICENNDILGVEGMEELSRELMLHVKHGKTPKVFQSWLRKYSLCTESQIGAWCRADELGKHLPMAQRKEGMVSSFADQT